MNVHARCCLSRVVSHAEEDRTSTGTLYCVAWRAFAPQLPCTPADRGKWLGPSINATGWQLATSQGSGWQTWERPARLQGLDARRFPIAGSTSGCLAFLRKLQVHTRPSCMCLDSNARILKVFQTEVRAHRGVLEGPRRYVLSAMLGSSPSQSHALQEALQEGPQPVHLRLSTAVAPAFSSNVCSARGSVAATIEAAEAWALIKVAVAEQLPACQVAGCQLDRLAATPRPSLEALAQQLPYEDVHAPAVHGRAWLAPALLAVSTYQLSVHDRAGTGHRQAGGMPAVVGIVQARQMMLVYSRHGSGCMLQAALSSVEA